MRANFWMVAARLCRISPPSRTCRLKQTIIIKISSILREREPWPSIITENGEERFSNLFPLHRLRLQPLEPLTPDWQLYQQPSTVDDPSSWDLFAKLNQVKPMEVTVQTQREYRHLSGALTQQQQTRSISVTQETVKSRQTSTTAPTMTFHGPETIYIGYQPKATQ